MAITVPTKPYTFTNGTGNTADGTEVNENFDTLFSKQEEVIDELNNADGSKDSLTKRLAVSINDDGTLKDAATSGGEWVNPDLTWAYVSGTEFTASGDHTDIYLALRRVKVTLAATTVYSEVSTSSYAAGTGLTTVTLADSVLDAGLDTVEHGATSPKASDGSVTEATIGLPRTASTFVQRNAGNTAYEAKTIAELSALVSSELSLSEYLPSTGDGKLTLKQSADAGWVLADDGTIGSAASGASTRASADTEDLYAVLWALSDSYAPVTGGRGASAAADFAADKPIALTRNLGRALVIAGAGSGLTSRSLGQYLGEEDHTLTAAEMASHYHTTTMNASGANSGFGAQARWNAYTGTDAGSVAVNTNSKGSGDEHNNMQPSSCWNIMIKL